MPGSIRVSVLEAFDLPDGVADGKYVSVKVAMGKREFQTKPSKADGGVTTPWNSDFVFPVLNLRDNLVIALLGSKGEELAKNEIEIPSIVEKGFQDQVLLLKGGGRIHLRLSFVLTEEERRRIELMRAAALKRREQQATKLVQNDLSRPDGNSMPVDLSSQTAAARPPFDERDETDARGKGEGMPTQDPNSPQQVFPRSMAAKPSTAIVHDNKEVHGLHGQSPPIDPLASGMENKRNPVSNEKSRSTMEHAANSSSDNHHIALAPSVSSPVAQKIAEPSVTKTVKEPVLDEKSRSTVENANGNLDTQAMVATPVSSPLSKKTAEPEEKSSSINLLSETSNNEDHGLTSLQASPNELHSPTFMVQVQDESGASPEKMSPLDLNQPNTKSLPVAKPTFIRQDEHVAPTEIMVPLDLNQPETSLSPVAKRSSQSTSLPIVQPDVDILSSTFGTSEGSSPEVSKLSAAVDTNPKSVKDKIKAFEKSMTKDVSAPLHTQTKLHMHEQVRNSPSRSVNQDTKREDNVIVVGSTSEKARDTAGESQAAVPLDVAAEGDVQTVCWKIEAEGNDSSVHDPVSNFGSTVHLQPFADQSNEGGYNVHSRKEEHGDIKSWSILDASKQVAFGVVLVVAGVLLWFAESSRRKSSIKQRFRTSRKN